ncbi:GGDEF domain-containing protein [Acidovorax sp. ACV01]|uniref:GGDEF domain-containing protein n=1 Tax=Acidovorax sp. ACV01 TaxID=2769311 RepID=UPI001CE10C04|nr:GGDEF domain-containing protein [Acidovorax sp. ACV01]
MGLQLDLPTVLLLYKTALVAGALSIFHVSRHSCRPQGLKPLAVAYLLLAIGAELAGRGEYLVLPDWLWTHTSLLLGTVGYPLFWAGMRALSGRRRIPMAVLVLVPGGWLVLGLVTQFPLDNLLRAGAFHITAAMALIGSAHEVWRDHRTEPLPSRPLLAALLLLSASIFALRLFYIATDNASSAGFARAFYVQMFCHFGIALMVSSLSSERAAVRLERMAQTDTLTGAGNRRWATSMLPARLPAGSAIAQLDLDHFKRINDRFGHAAGDRVLVASAQALRSQLRDSDLLARMGGEEFLVYLPDATASDAAAVAQRLCTAVEQIRLSEQGEDIPVTISIGLACVNSGGGTWADWLGAADRALYDAKRAGRNRVVVTHERTA